MPGYLPKIFWLLIPLSVKNSSDKSTVLLHRDLWEMIQYCSFTVYLGEILDKVNQASEIIQTDNSDSGRC